MKTKKYNHSLTLTGQASKFMLWGVATTVGVMTLNAHAQTNNAVSAKTESHAGRVALAQPKAEVSQAMGRIWITEDPVLLEPSLNVSASDKVAFQSGQIKGPISFSVYSNYAAFIKKAEIRLYSPDDSDRISPMVVLAVPLGLKNNQVSVEWDGKIKDAKSYNLRETNKLQYVLRVTDSEGRWDETKPGSIELVSDVERARALDALKQNSDLGTQLRSKEAGLSLEDYGITTGVYGNSNLAVQNIVLRGGKVRLRGQDIPAGMSLSVNGQSVPIDIERKFIAEYLLPVGMHHFDLEAKNAQGQVFKNELDAQVRGEYWFMVGLADITHSKNSYSGQVEAVSLADYERFGQSHTDGRLAFYLKGKIQGKYLITAHADTLEKEGKDLFKNFFKSDRTDLLRVIDPNVYYPVYGDDSTSRRDVDTSGRLYVRLDWDKSSVIWGNVKTEFNSSDIAAYNRNLYGAKIAYLSTDTTLLGEPKTQIKAFAAEQQTAPGRSELLGTGGSLYFLRHTDLVPSSETITLEIRDKDSDRVTSAYSLKSGRDYEMDSLQGRLILSRPLSQISRDNSPIQDTPQDGSRNVLVASYEYYPTSLQQDNYSAGVSVKQWAGEHMAVGATYAKERRTGDDYQLQGVDLTLQNGQGTWVKFQHAQSKSALAPVFYSQDGGLSFDQYGNGIVSNSTGTDSAGTLSGKSTSVEARLNTKEQGWTKNTWKVATWWRKKDAGFSAEHTVAIGKDITDAGVEVVGQVNDDIQVIGGYKQVKTQSLIIDGSSSTNQLERTSLGIQLRPGSDLTILGEVQQVKQTATGQDDAVAGLVGLRVTKRLLDRLEIYAASQASFSQKNYKDNNAYTVGSKYAFDDGSNVALEYTDGNRGSALTASAEYKHSGNYSIYTSYTYSPYTSSPTTADSLIAARTFNKYTGWTVGQRLQLAQEWRLVTESQWLNDSSGDGQVNNMGLEFVPKEGWNFGFSVQKGKLDKLETTASTDRQALSLSGAFTDSRINWASKIEYRLDQTTSNGEAVAQSTGIGSHQTQWLSTNRLTYKVSDDWRLLGKFNYSQTGTTSNVATVGDVTNASLTDGSIGFAWRPTQGPLNLLAKYNYLYDLAPLGQQNTIGSDFDQRTRIASIEATYELNPNWEVAGKLARRNTSTRLQRGTGEWFSNDATYAAGQVRWHIGDRGLGSDGQAKDLWSGWSVLGEYRMLKVERDGIKKGALFSLDKDVSENMRFGLGYNFTDFSSDLTQLSFKYKGWFLNAVARF